MAVSVNLEMSLDREEFLRLLSAVGPHAVGTDGVIRGSGAAGSWSILLHRLPERRIGSVALPRLRVDLTFEGYSDGERETFMIRFHRAFQRGGG